MTRKQKRNRGDVTLDPQQWVDDPHGTCKNNTPVAPKESTMVFAIKTLAVW